MNEKVGTVTKGRRSKDATPTAVKMSEGLRSRRRESIARHQIDHSGWKVVDQDKKSDPAKVTQYLTEVAERIVALSLRTQSLSEIVTLTKYAELHEAIRRECNVEEDGKSPRRLGHQITSHTRARVEMRPLTEQGSNTPFRTKKTSVSTTSVKRLVAAAQKMGKAVTSIAATPDGSIIVSIKESSSTNERPSNPFDVVLR